MGALAGQDHGTAGTDAHDPGSLLDQLHSLLHQMGLYQFDGLVYRIRGKTSNLLAPACGGIGGVGLGHDCGRNTVPCQLNFKGVETLQF